MNKITTLALAGLVAIGATASASVSRWNGFGAAQAYIADVQDIWTLPGVVASHKNATYIEIGKTTNGFESGENFGYDANRSCCGQDAQYLFQDLAPNTPWGGVHAEVGPGVLGVWINRPYTSNMNSVVTNEFGRPSTFNGGSLVSWNISVDQTADVLYGFSLSDATTLGVSVSRAVAYRTYKSEDSTGTYSNGRDFSDLGLGLGLEQKNVGPIALLEVGLKINMKSQTNEEKTTAYDDKYTRNGSALGIRIGGDLAGDEGKFGRFELGLNGDGMTIKAEPQTAPASGSYVEGKDSHLGYNLGYAMGKSNDKGMGLVGLMLISNVSNGDAPNYYGADTVAKVTYNELRLELSTAGEAKLNSWLTLRAGFAGDLFSAYSRVRETGPASSTTKQTWSDNERWNAGGPSSYNNLAKATFGTTVTLGNLTLDGVLNQDILYTGGYLLSGVAAVPTTQVSATWGW